MANSDQFVINGMEIYKQACPKSLGIQIYHSLKDNPDKQIIDRTNDISVSFEKIFWSSCSIAKWLEEEGCLRNEIISVCSENSVHFFKPVIAALYSGIIVACVNHTYTEDELLHALTLTKPKFAFCSSATYQKFHSLHVQNKIPFVQKILILENLDNNPEMAKGKTFTPLDFNTKEQTAVILYSSGTTGLAKAVMISHDNINIRQTHITDPRLSRVEDNDFNFVTMPFFHAIGFMLGVSQLVRGKDLILLQKFEELRYLATIAKYRIKRIIVVPPLMILLAKSANVDKFDITCVEGITCGAAPMSKEVENSVRERFPHIKYITQSFGMTETTLRALGFPAKIENKFGSCGKAVPGSQVKIRDPESGRSLGPNKVGELCIKSGLVMQGYYGNPEATKAMITEDGWLLSGDLAYYDDDEYFYIVDRLKELIKFKGFQVAPAELEALLLKHPKISDAAVVGLPDESVGEKPLAFVVKQNGVDLQESEVRKYVADNVSYAKQLHGGVTFVSAIPKNPSGKILRKELRKLVNKSKL